MTAFPPNKARGFDGNRVEPSRAGMMPTKGTRVVSII
jgi:hypothetical protein